MRVANNELRRDHSAPVPVQVVCHSGCHLVSLDFISSKTDIVIHVVDPAAMDKELSAAPKVEAVPEDIAMQSEHPQQHEHHHSLTIDETHTPFFQDERHMDADQGQQQPDPPTPPQRASRPDVAAEDLQLGGHGDDQIQQLQLAAQMSQALREVVGSGNAVVENNYDTQDGPNLSSLQQLQDGEAETDMRSPAQGLSEPHGLPELPDTQELQQTLEQVIPHHDHQQDSQTPHAPHPPPLSQHNQYMDGPSQPALAPAIPLGGTQSQYAIGDMTPPRKRSKVSRACDECRRKKIKCDATSETGEEICSNCRRSNVRCMFSRVPQKRGPSKGYIKELADRINSIEGKLGGQSVAEALAGELTSRRNLGENHAASPQGEDARKRPFSHISSNNVPTHGPNRQPGWSADARPAISQQPSYTANGLALKPILPRESSSSMPPSPPAIDGVRASIQATQPPAALPEIGDDVYYAYLNIVHHVLPFLPSSKDILASHLAQCSPSLHLAFVEAVNSAMSSFASALSAQGSLTAANRLLADFEGEGGKRPQATDLIHLQCLILMIINVDNYGPASLTREHEGPAKATLLGRAAGLAYSMGIPHEAMTLSIVGFVESEKCIRVRAWWTLVILDRWNAISTATPLVISGDAIVLPHNLKPVLGEANYRFTLLAYIMGHWTPASVIAPENLTPGAGAQASATFHLNMEMWRAHFPGDIPPNAEPVLHLAYWHCRLLAFMFMPSALITDVTWAVKESVRLLTSHPQMMSPLNHHFTSLTTLCLIEMSKAEKSSEEATQLLSNLLGASIAPSTWDEAIRAKIQDALRPLTGSGAEITASQSLQHLADLATAADIAKADTNTVVPSSVTEAPAVQKVDEEPKFRTSDNYEDLGFNPRIMLRAGYLNAIPQLSA